MISDFKEATQAVARIATIQRDLYILNAKLRAAREAKRLALWIAGAFFLNLLITLTLFWVILTLHGNSR